MVMTSIVMVQFCMMCKLPVHNVKVVLQMCVEVRKYDDGTRDSAWWSICTPFIQHTGMLDVQSCIACSARFASVHSYCGTSYSMLICNEIGY